MRRKLVVLTLILIAGFALSAIADEESQTATRRDAVDVSIGDNDQWRYSLQQPAADWQDPDFDAAAWKTGTGGFGTHSTPSAKVGTTWDANDIWLRRSLHTKRNSSRWYYYCDKLGLMVWQDFIVGKAGKQFAKQPAEAER